jgi:hypothetical protein
MRTRSRAANTGSMDVIAILLVVAVFASLLGLVELLDRV